MINSKLLIIALFFGLVSCNNTPSMDKATDKIDKATDKIAEIVVDSEPERLLRHVVMFKFQDTATPEQVKVVEDAFHALKSKIDVIHDYEWGINNSPEGLNKGLTHCFFVTFKSEADREIYLPHPDHLAFVEVLKPVLDDVTVIDYWSETD